MRRLISYYLLGGAMLLTVGLLTVPLVQRLNTDVAYNDGRSLYFKASQYDPDSVTGNYGNDAGLFLGETDKDNKGNPIIEDIADTFRKRLDNYSSTEYDVATIGYDTIKVTLRSSRDLDTKYQYLSRYLPFSGEVYELDAADTTYDDYPDDDKYKDILNFSAARIETRNLGTGVDLPTVIIPLKEGEEYQNSFRNLVSYCETNTVEEVKDDEGNVTTPAKSCPIIIWANRVETDTYASAETDPNIHNRILVEIPAATAKYVPESDKEKEEAEQTLSLCLVPNSAAWNEGKYDPDKGADAYEAASFYLQMLHASKFEYEVAGSTKAEYRVSYLYQEKAYASVENIVSLGDGVIYASFSRTMIATLIGVFFIVAGLIAFERAGAMAGAVSIFLTPFLSFAIFFAFGAQFNLAALVALAATALIGGFGYFYYVSRLRGELYKGRTLKKANAEASKKSTWPIVDMGVASVILGVCMYAFGGDIFSKAGLMLAVGGVISMLVNLIITRILMWILTNDDTMQSSFPKMLRVNEKLIPDLLKEEKQSYFGPFANKDLKKGHKIGLIVSAVLLAAGIGTTVAFQAVNGTPYNDPSLGSSETSLRLEIRSTDQNKISGTTAAALYSSSELRGLDNTGAPRLLSAFELDGKILDNLVDDIKLSEPKLVYYTPDAGEGVSEYWYTYDISFKSSIDLKKDHAIKVWNGALDADDKPVYVEAASSDINEALSEMIELRYISEVSDFNARFASIVHAETQPYLWQVTLALGVGFAISALYFMLRFRPGKGLALSISGFALSIFGTLFLAATRIPAAPIVAVGVALSSIAILAYGLFILNGEKEYAKESKEKEKGTLEFKVDSLEKATTYEAGNVMTFSAYAAYIAIVYFGFGPYVYSRVYVGAFIAIVLGLLFMIVCFPGVASFLMKIFGKIHIRAPKRKKKKTTGQLMKKKTSEAEESIFIGIND